jgi:hypothetical protein
MRGRRRLVAMSAVVVSVLLTNTRISITISILVLIKYSLLLKVLVTLKNLPFLLETKELLRI